MCASPNAKRICRVTSSSERLLSSDYIFISATGVRYVIMELLGFSRALNLVYGSQLTIGELKRSQTLNSCSRTVSLLVLDTTPSSQTLIP